MYMILLYVAVFSAAHIFNSAAFQLKNEHDFLELVKNNEQKFGENFYEFLNRITHGKIYNISVAGHDMLEKMGYHIPTFNKSVIPDFDCNTTFLKNHTKATSVHRLTPYDVDIIGAMGDSLTAGFGECACTLIDLFIECRGVSWSVGGDGNIKKYLTLPNVLKEYSPKLTGYSVGISPPLIYTPNNHLNVAVSGSTSPDMLDQAKDFVKHLITNPDYDFFGSWKVLTLFIGGNDLCSCCRTFRHYNEKYSPENYTIAIKVALDYLHERVPKLFVNLINAPDVTILQDLASFKCDITHLIECKCGTVYGEKARNFTHYTCLEYHQKLQELISSGRYDTRDDFTVVIQPFFDKTIVPRLPNGDVDRSYFAPDCFHFSRKAHAASALALWNSMIEPVGKKSRHWEEHEQWKCPSEQHPYFYTSKNSNGEILIDDRVPTVDHSTVRNTLENEDNPYKITVFTHLRQLFVKFHTYLRSGEKTIVVISSSQTVDETRGSEWYDNIDRNGVIFFILSGFMFMIIMILMCKSPRKV